MTVAELIDELRNYTADTQVLTFSSNGRVVQPLPVLYEKSEMEDEEFDVSRVPDLDASFLIL